MPTPAMPPDPCMAQCTVQCLCQRQQHWSQPHTLHDTSVEALEYVGWQAVTPSRGQCSGCAGGARGRHAAAAYGLDESSG
eukprot:2871142-Pleurochrysis_carterae.AAC.4